MLDQIQETSTWLEVFWTTTGVLAFSSGVWALWFFINRYREAKARDERRRGVIFLGAGKIAQYGVKVVGLFFTLNAGLLAMITPPTNPQVPVTLNAFITLLSIAILQIAVALEALIAVYVLNKAHNMNGEGPPKALSNEGALAPQ